MNKQELAFWRGRHHPDERRHCITCGLRAPCDFIALVERIAEAEEREGRYRAVLEKVAHHLPPVQTITEWDATTPLCCYCWNVVEQYGHEPNCVVGQVLAESEG